MAGPPDSTTVVLRSPHLLEGRVWVSGCPDPSSAARLSEVASELAFFGRDLPTHRALGDAGFSVEYSAWPGRSECQTALLYLPKGKDRFMLDLAAARELLPAGGRLLVTGPKRGGIKSAGKQLEKAGFLQLERVDSARHCSLLQAVSPGPSGASLSDFRSSWQLPEVYGALQIVSYPGLFHHGSLDEGTSLLLAALSDPSRARHIQELQRALDIGSGAGVIGAWLAANSTAEVTCVDSDALAVLATGETIEANGLEKAVAVAGDVWSEADGRYELVVSNPPFHRGLGTNYTVPERIIDDAAGYLATKGHLVVVANAFLSYPSRIQENLGNCMTWEETGRFRVWASAMTRRARQQYRGRLRAAETGHQGRR